MDDLTREKIDLYILNKMDEKTRRDFEAQMTADKSLAKEVLLQKEAFNLLDALGDQKMRSTLDQIHDKVVGGESNSFFNKRTIVILLLGLLALSGFLYYYFIASPPVSQITPERAYIQYYEDYPLSLASRDGDQLSLDLQKVNALYKNKNYQEVLSILEQLIEQKPDTKLQMAAGISALQTDDFQKALNYFNGLINLKDPLYQNQAKWYAALTALKQGNSNLAKQYLQALIDSGSNYKRQDSQELLQRLK